MGEAMAKRYELHFQEGFDHDRVEIHIGDKMVEQDSLTTRMQIGLAKIAEIEAGPGKVLKVKFPELGEEVSVKLQKSQSYVCINKKENRLAIEWADVSPGYL